jgi:hypothetical protein
MARPNRRDFITWLCTVPSSVVLCVCLFLPQVKDCHGNTKTAFETNTYPLLIVLAVIGIVPVLWHSRPLQRPILLVVGLLAAAMLIGSVFGVAILIVLALKRTWSDEEAVALCCFSLVLVFLFLFPFLMLFGDWRRGAELTWAVAWIQLFGMIWWAVAAADRR